MWLTAVLLALSWATMVYLNYPTPELTDSALAMRQTGSFFHYHAHDERDFQIFYRDLRGDGPKSRTLFLMHGFPISSHDWNAVLPGLQSDFGRLIVPEQLGYGLSDKPLDRQYTIAEQADIMESMLKELSVGDAHFLCHDTGLTVCLEMLARFNARQAAGNMDSGVVFNSFAFNNGGMFTEFTTPILIQKLAALPVAGDLVGYVMPRVLLERSLRKTFGAKKPPSREFLDTAFSLMGHKNGFRALPKILHYIHERAVFEDRWIGAMLEATIPMHYMYNPSDTVNKEVTFQHFKKTVTKATTARMPEHTGHWGMVEEPVEFVRLYKEFFATLNA